jgi:uncharacterized protein YegL
VTLTATPDRRKVARGSDGRVRVRVDVHAGVAPGTDVRPADIVVAIDTSGSMSGEKIETARRSVDALVDAMGPQDRLAVVAFASGAEVLRPRGDSAELTNMTPENRQQWHARLHGLESGGGTDMLSGLSEAVRLAEASEGRSTRILLVTDGVPNTEVGLDTLAREAAATATPLTAVGIGEGYNERLLTTLADLGTGNFFWARPEMNLEEVFDAELHDAGTAVASSTRLLVHGDIRLAEAGGLPLEPYDQAQVLKLGTLLAGRTRTLWLSFDVPTGGEKTFDLGTLTLDWNGGGGREQAEVALGSVEVVEDADEALAAIDDQTWESGVIGEAWSACREDVAALAQKGDKAAAIARLASCSASPWGSASAWRSTPTARCSGSSRAGWPRLPSCSRAWSRTAPSACRCPRGSRTCPSRCGRPSPRCPKPRASWPAPAPRTWPTRSRSRRCAPRGARPGSASAWAGSAAAASASRRCAPSSRPT